MSCAVSPSAGDSGAAGLAQPLHHPKTPLAPSKQPQQRPAHSWAASLAESSGSGQRQQSGPRVAGQEINTAGGKAVSGAGGSPEEAMRDRAMQNGLLTSGLRTRHDTFIIPRKGRPGWGGSAAL